MCHYIRESGAGKTEAAKQIMQYIANVSVDQDNVEISKIKDMVLATNPLLESFGCAKTLRNNNSSRHGKYLEIKFSEGNYQPIAAHITNYLLEKQELCLKSLMNVISIFLPIHKALSSTISTNVWYPRTRNLCLYFSS